MEAEDPKEVVRRGYDAVSRLYDEEYGGETKYSAWLGELAERIPAGGSVLDLGCGSGLPVARDLVAAGFQITGVDISAVQIRRAAELVPAATFLRADISSVDFDESSFDAVVTFFALIHLPLDDQLPLLHRIAGWLRPGGLFVATTGHSAWTGYMQNWLDGGEPMWWSHADAATYRAWIDHAGLVIDREEFVPEGTLPTFVVIGRVTPSRACGRSTCIKCRRAGSDGAPRRPCSTTATWGRAGTGSSLRRTSIISTAASCS